MQKNVLITGKPRSGKSTLLKKLISGIADKVGFVTCEILGENGRLGFEIETHTGRKEILAHVDFKTKHHVSKYFVDTKNMEAVMPEVSSFEETSVLYLDEIGEMQLFSEQFKGLVLAYLDAPNTCIATLSYVFEDEFIKDIKKRDDIILMELAAESRGEKEQLIRQLLSKIEKARRYIAEPERFAFKGDVAEVRSEHDVRTLTREGSRWICTCNFYGKNGICSHVIAAKELQGP